jgi:hypothetical protein
MASDITSGRQTNPINAANKVMNHIWENHIFISTKGNTLEERTGISYLIGLNYIELNRPHHYQLTESGKKAYLNGGIKDNKLRKSKKTKDNKFLEFLKEWIKPILIGIIITVGGYIIISFL